MTMKTLFLSCLAYLFLTISASSQNHSFDRFFDRYAGKDGFLTVKLSNLPSLLFNDEKNDPDLRITSLRVLTAQDSFLNQKLNFYNEIVPQINRVGYEELMSVKRKGDKSILLCKKNNKRISEVLYVSGGLNNVMVEITGSLSLEQAKKITSEAAESHDIDK